MMMNEPQTFTALRGTLARDVPLARYTSWRCGGPGDTRLRAGRSRRSRDLRSAAAGRRAAHDRSASAAICSCATAASAVPSSSCTPRSTCSTLRDGLDLRRGGRGEPQGRALRGEARLRRSGIPGRHSGHGRRRARDERRLLRWRDVALRRPRRSPDARRIVRGAASRRVRDRIPLGASRRRRRRRRHLHRGVVRLSARRWRAARVRIAELLRRRIATQPLDLPNAGSVFRNPPGDHAARLIESCGLKGYAVGGARVSEKHANFIVNPRGAAKAADIEAIIAHVRSVVRARPASISSPR